MPTLRLVSSATYTLPSQLSTSFSELGADYRGTNLPPTLMEKLW